MELILGFSTGAVARGDVSGGIAVARRHATDLVELSCLHERELPSVEEVLAAGAAGGFARISVHGPAKGRALPESELVSRLDGLGTDVVMHPDVLDELAPWRRLGPRLLVENNDSRKAYGQGPAHLDEVFAVVGEARMCLDVSHALDAGGHGLLVELVGRYGARIAQLHVGCDHGPGGDHVLGPELIDGVRVAAQLLGRPLAVVLERPTPASDTRALEAQLFALACL